MELFFTLQFGLKRLNRPQDQNGTFLYDHGTRILKWKGTHKDTNIQGVIKSNQTKSNLGKKYYVPDLIKVKSVQEACTKCFAAVHILKFEILQIT